MHNFTAKFASVTEVSKRPYYRGQTNLPVGEAQKDLAVSLVGNSEQ